MALLKLTARSRRIGLLMIIAGILVLLVKAVYDIAAEMTQARREFRALSKNGLISPEETVQKDRILIEKIEKSRISGKKLSSEKNDPGNSGGTAFFAQESPAAQCADGPAEESETISADEFATASLEYLNADGEIYKPADKYNTVNLES